MDRKEDIEFLERFRSLVVEFLTKSSAGKREDDANVQRKMINEMIPRVSKLLSESGLESGLVQLSPERAGRRVKEFESSYLDLITSHTQRSFFWRGVSDEFVLDAVLDMVDKGIGHLKMASLNERTETARNNEMRHANIGRKVFIAMPMAVEDLQLEDIHEAIKDAATDAGLEAERIDEQISNEKITDRIVKAISDADYMVADLSQAKPNVYWEAGYAHGMEKTPIYIAREGTELEFDVKDYPVIFYENATRLRNKLAERLQGLKNTT